MLSSAPRLLAACLFAVSLGAPSLACADEPEKLVWRDDWARFRPAEYVAVPVLGVGMLATGLAAPGTTDPAWTGRNDLDDAGRRALRIASPTGRAWARGVSDVLYIGLTIYPAAIESLLLARLVHKSPDVAWQLFMMYGETALSSGVLTIGAQGLGSRRRPLADECDKDPGYDPMCGTKQLSRSFFAGHVSMAFVGASLTCVNQAHLPLYGDGLGGPIACAATMAGAATTAVLRVAADKHWSTDVLVGAGVGLSAGLLIPLGLHYGFGSSSVAARTRVTAVPIGDQGALMMATGLW
ncbi:MAG: phosphatase PAP2 family protein [Myxococcales bacterium]|nr:MAG: phosphatase PAP2 family protein [Myxococcales bacterium]